MLQAVLNIIQQFRLKLSNELVKLNASQFSLPKK